MRGYNACLLECGNHVRGPKGGVVCDDCRRKVKEYDALIERTKRESASVALRYHAYVPGGSTFAPNKRKLLEEALRRFRAALLQSNYRFYAPTDPDLYVSDHLSKRDREEIRRFYLPTALAQAYADIEALIVPAMYEAEADGKRAGAHLLGQLAAGEVTLGDLEKRAGLVPSGAGA